MAARIEDYAMIGNCRSAALVCRTGSIDWLCLPRFDSGACFAAILGTSEHGRWLLAPVDEAATSTRCYRDGGLVLETLWETATGKVRVVDFMPVHSRRVGVMRVVEGVEGSVSMREELVIRFDYGRTIPWVSTDGDGHLRAIAGPDLLVRRSPIATEGRDLRSVATFEVQVGESIPFALDYGLSHLDAPEPLDVHDVLAETDRFWSDWSRSCNESGEWSDAVRKSLVVLKGLSYMPTGGIIAAPTTSLPEFIGGGRNWDYRFCWARDATYVLTALMNAGYREEAVAWRQWLHRAIAGTPDQLQIMYGIRGERRMHEHELPWLPGYENSTPVRIGNAAADQFQLDVYGELAGAFDHGRRTGIFDPDPIAENSDGSDSMQVLFLNHLAGIWDRPDEGIWEIRGESRHFVHSKVMAWLAFRRAADQPRSRIAARFQDSWAELADRIHADICAKGVDPDGNHFVQSYGSKELDASLLVVTLSGFLPEDDPRVVNTVRAIEQRLMVKGLVKRYNTFSGIDGLEPGEGMFLPCSFWLVENYVMLGRMDDARTLFAKLVALCNDVGLLAEEYDPVAGRQLGNFPQAFSHVALVNAAYSITHAKSSISRTHEPASHD